MTDNTVDPNAPPPLKRDVRDMMDPTPLTMRRGVFAKSAFKRALGTNEQPTDVARLVDKHAGKMSEWSGCVAETHAMLYDPAGNKRLPDDDMDSVGAEFRSTLEQQAAIGELKAAARCHPLVAAEATRDLCAGLATQMGLDAMKEDEDAAKRPEDLQQELEDVEAMDIDPDAPDAEQMAKDKEEAIQQIKDALNKARARRTGFNERLEQAKRGGGIARVVNRVAKETQKKADAVNALTACGAGKDDGGGGESEPITKEMIQQALRMEDFAKIVDLVGRMQSAADQKAEEADGLGKLAPSGLCMTKEMVDLLASEWMLEDADPDLWTKRLLDGEMAGIERESPEPKHKGDLLIFVDKSGSMNGQRILWARALAIAAIMRAQREGRRWVMTAYSHGVQYLTTASSTGGFAKGLEAVSAIAAGGGTDTDGAIHHVVTNTDLAGGLRDPDILLVTDGEWEDLKKSREALAQHKMRLFIVQLEGYVREVEGATKVWRINNLDINEAARVLCDVTL